jgi:murein L,D-transpeptidase YafK
MPPDRRLPLLLALTAMALLATPAPAWADQPAGKAEYVLVLKAERELRLMRDGKVLKAYPIALGRHPVGQKLRQGDGRTPEGYYAIDGRLRDSAYHLALHISYPSDADRARARAAGVAPGDDILIHGMPAEFGRTDPVRFFVDWTDGCIAVGNLAIEEIWAAVDDGTPVAILP